MKLGPAISTVAAVLTIAISVPAGAGAVRDRRIVFAAGRAIFSVRPDGGGYNKLASDVVGVPVWSPDKRLIAFTRYDGSAASVWVMNADGSDEQLVTGNGDSPAWSPGGDRLVFVRRDDPVDPLATGDRLITVAVDGSDEAEVARAPESVIDSPQWSPDGAQIAFVAAISTDDGDPTTFDEDNLDIYKVVLGSGEIVRLTDDPDRDEDPRWSPNGDRLAFVSDRDDEQCGEGSDGCPYTTEIYLMDADGGSEQRFTHNALHHDRNHEWAPDGRALVWNRTTDDDVNSRCCNAEIVLKAVGGGSRGRLLTKDDRFDLDPSFSPSGRWVVFMSARGGGMPDLFKIRVDGTRRTRLTSTARAEAAPDW